MPAQQFPFIARDRALGPASLAPMMPITLQAAKVVSVSALLDTGSAVNVLPYDIGLQLGFICDQQTNTVQLSGNLASVEARVVLLAATVAQFPPVNRQPMAAAPHRMRRYSELSRLKFHRLRFLSRRRVVLTTSIHV